MIKGFFSKIELPSGLNLLKIKIKQQNHLFKFYIKYFFIFLKTRIIVRGNKDRKRKTDKSLTFYYYYLINYNFADEIFSRIWL